MTNPAPFNKSGPWKEGRQGAASLCYINLQPEALERVLAHHASVGIRASLVCTKILPNLSILAERNWDLLAGQDPELHLNLKKLDGQSKRGCFEPNMPTGDQAETLYRLSTVDADIPAPAPDLLTPLPSHEAPTDPVQLLNRIEEVVTKAEWGIWRIDGRVLNAMGDHGHQHLLQRLGDHHARIWCAPIRDIALWQPAS